MSICMFWFLCGILTILIMLNDIRRSPLTLTEVLDDFAGYIILLTFFLGGPLSLVVVLSMKLIGK